MIARTARLPLIALLGCLIALCGLPGAYAQSTDRPVVTTAPEEGADATPAPSATDEEEAEVEETGEEAEEELVEELPELEELTAAEQFAALPRFGERVFAQESADGREPTESAPAPDETAGVAVPPSYIIGPGDEMAIRVWTDAIEHVSATPVVDVDGRVYLELLGEVIVAGESLSEVREQIVRRYRVFFTRAEVSVGLARTRTIEVRVTGDVQRPGKYRLSGDATLFAALYAAGGPSEIGSLRGVKLLRRGQEPVIADLYLYLLEGDISGDVSLQPEDTVFVPAAGPTVGVAGEVRRPSRYELLGETTLAQALEMAAGVAATGYAHNLEVWRVGESGRRELINVDARDGRDLTVQDGDLIVATPVLEDPENVVELSGAVLRPGVYEVREGMTVSDLLAVAQGLSADAHTEEAALWRLGADLDYELTAFDLAAAMAGDAVQDLALQPRDRLIVLSEEDVERPMQVEAMGAVLRPAVVPWVRGMRVSDLVKRAGGLAEGAYTPQANLLRLGPDERREIIPVDLDRVMAGDDGEDVLLARGDVLEVLAREVVTDESLVRVAGLVNEPGRHPRLQGMRVSDAILAAGGLSRRAGDQVEYTAAGVFGRVQPIYLALRRQGDAFVVEPDPIVNDNDFVAVLGAGDLIPEPSEITIRGRVARPGTYALQRTANDPDTVYKLIQRAGGLLEDANPNGIVLYRLREQIIDDEQEGDLEQVIGTFNRELSSATIEGEEQRAAGMAGQLAQGLQTALFEGATTVIIAPRRLSKEAWARAVPIDGQRLIDSEGREQDFPLSRGDVIVVPRMPTTVTVMGAVIRPGALAWQEGLRAFDYVERAGGMTPDARDRRTVVIRANSEVKSEALHAEVYPGDVILVPSDYIFREVNKPGTFERILTAVTGILTGYLIFK